MTLAITITVSHAMKACKGFRFYPGMMLVLLSLSNPGVLFARTIEVPTEFSTIQRAVDAALPGDVIQVMPRDESYKEKIVLTNGITLEGVEPDRTIIDGLGGVVISAGNSTSIRKLTIRGGSTGIAVTGASNVTISNNIIVENTTGINCVNSSVVINQNTIHRNPESGISCATTQSISITNNLLTNNGTAVNLGNINAITVGNNGFNANASNGEEGSNPVKAGDPLFVNPVQNDYHVKTGSPFLGDDLVNPGDDLGAYGGSGANLIPARVRGLSVVPGADNIEVRWSPNLAYNVSGYRLYVDKNKAISETASETDLTICDNTQCAFIKTGLEATVTEPGRPILNPAVPGDQKLFLTWVPPTNEGSTSSYRVFWGTASGDYTAPGSPRSVGDVTGHTLLGLGNDTTYFIALQAVAEPRFFVSVTAIVNLPSVNESTFLEQKEVTLTGIEPRLSPLSNEVSEFPEAVVGFPKLPDEGGCFIATAAFGSALAPQVQILRDFRDQYLLPTAAGRGFVALYYQYSPPFADFIQEHDFAKSMVRLLLLPLLGLSYFLLKTTLIQKAGVFLVLSVVWVFMMRVREKHRRQAVL